MPTKRKSRSARAASSSTNDAAATDSRQTKRLQLCLPAAFAHVSSAVVHACIVSCLQLPELFELSHVSAAFTEVSRQAAVDWMQREFASIVRRRSLPAPALPVPGAAEEKKGEQQTEQAQQQPGATSAPEPAAAAPFTFTLSDARFVRSEMQRWGVTGSLSARRLSEPKMLEHFKAFPGSKDLAEDVCGRRFVPFCTLEDVLGALFAQYKHAEDYAQWRETAGARQHKRQRRSSESKAAQQQQSKKAAKKGRRRKGRAARPLLLLQPDSVIGGGVIALLEFTEIMDLRAVCSSLKPVCERQAALWMAATFPAGLATISRQLRGEEGKAEEEDSGDEKQKDEKVDAAAAAESSPSLSCVSSSSCSPLSQPVSSSIRPHPVSVAMSQRVPAAAAEPSASSPCSLPFFSPSSSSSSSSSPAVRGLPAASFSVADCVWLRRQLDRAQLLNANEHANGGSRRGARRPAKLINLSLSAEEVAEWYRLSLDERDSCRSHQHRYYRYLNRRWNLLDALSIVLKRHGHVASFSQELTERRLRLQRLRSAHEQRRAARRQAVNAALAAEGLQATWLRGKGPKQPWRCQQAEFEWWKNGGWRKTWTLQPQLQGSPELHRALRALGMACIGKCGWGGCVLQADKQVEEEMEQDSESSVVHRSI